jgi:hypothetical protein
VLRLARAAAMLGLPTIFTTSEEEGENGRLLPALEQILALVGADCERIRRVHVVHT